MKTLFLVYQISYVVNPIKLVAGLGERQEPPMQVIDKENGIIEGVPDAITMDIIRNIELQHQVAFEARMKAMNKEIKYLRVTIVNIVVLETIDNPHFEIVKAQTGPDNQNPN